MLVRGDADEIASGSAPGRGQKGIRQEQKPEGGSGQVVLLEYPGGAHGQFAVPRLDRRRERASGEHLILRSEREGRRITLRCPVHGANAVGRPGLDVRAQQRMFLAVGLRRGQGQDQRAGDGAIKSELTYWDNWVLLRLPEQPS